MNTKRIVLSVVGLLLLTGSTVKTLAQAPNISYSSSSQVYTVGTSITSIAPVNTGGTTVRQGQTTTYSGTGTTSTTGTTLSTATFNQPLGATIDKWGNLYISEAGSHIIRKITPAGSVSVFAGAFFSGPQDDDNGLPATFYHPVGLATDAAAGNVYVADEDNNYIRKITSLGAVSTFAGNTTQGDAVGTLTSAKFNSLAG